MKEFSGNRKRRTKHLSKQGMIAKELKRYIKNGKNVYKWKCYATHSFEVEVQADSKEESEDKVLNFISTGDSSPWSIKPSDFQLEYYNDGFDEFHYMGDEEVELNYLDEYFKSHYPELVFKRELKKIARGMMAKGKKALALNDDNHIPLLGITMEREQG